MTVANNYAVTSYTGNGSTTSFSFSWPVYQTDDVVVYQNVSGVESIVPSTSYSVTTNASGGTVVFNTAPASGVKIAITRQTPLSQDTPYKTSSGFDAAVVEQDFDKQVMSLQEMSKEMDRCVKTSVTSNVDPEELAAQVERIYTSIDNVDSVADDETNVNIVATNASNINTVAGSISNVNSVAGSISNVNSVAGDLTNINAVKADLTNIDTVAGDLTNIDAVAGDLTNINAVKADLTNIDAVAGDLTNIDAVAADLTNIDAASTYANNANVWAEGTDEQVALLGGEHSAEEWAKIASISAGISRNIGEIVCSTVPLTDSALHLLDGSLISGSGVYSDFVDYIAGLYEDNPAANYFAQEQDYLNATQVGGTLSDSFVFTGASASYIQLPEVAPFSTADSWEVKTKYTYNGGGTYPVIFGSGTGDMQDPLLVVDSGYINFDLTSSSGSWNITTPQTTAKTSIQVSTGTTYYLKFGFTGTKYYVDYNTDGSDEYTNALTVNSTTKTYTSANPNLFLNATTNTSTYYSGGSVDLTETSITIDGELWWSGVETYTPEEVWQNSVTKYGACGKFVYDSVNNTVRLPKITCFTEASIDVTSLGDLTEAGLPNITGSFSVSDLASVSHDFTGTGCFVNNGNGTSPYAGGGGNPNTYRLIDIDASRSSSIYGNSTTVQPQSIKVLYYIVVAATIKTDIQVDIDEIATDLNGKADVDLTNAVPAFNFALSLNAAGIRTVIETYVNGTSWYRIWSDGWCEQGGILNKGGMSVTTENILLLKPYKDTNYNVVATIAHSSTYACYTPMLVIPFAKTQFSCGMTGSNWQSVCWRACGYIDLGENS